MIKYTNYGLGSALLMLLWALVFFFRMLGKTDILILANLFFSASVLVVLIYFMWKRHMWPYVVLLVITVVQLLYVKYNLNQISSFLILNVLLQCVGLFGIIAYKKQIPTIPVQASNTEVAEDSREERMRKRFESRKK